MEIISKVCADPMIGEGFGKISLKNLPPLSKAVRFTSPLLLTLVESPNRQVQMPRRLRLKTGKFSRETSFTALLSPIAMD
jgi:hypothetical protein